MKRLLILVSMVVLAFGIVKAQDEEPPFYYGVDLSYVNEVEDCGAIYRENGESRDPFELFAERGASLVRARLWHNPDWTDYSTLPDVKRTFQRARDAGMDTLLDFHYSDNWADPGRQEIPVAWEDIEDTGELADVLYQYTYDVLSELHAEGLTPAFVQVGNETNSGMLKQGEAQDWNRDAQLFNAGIRAVRDFSTETGADVKIILHVAQPENTGWWFTQAEAAGITDFDVIGISYYPQWSVFTISEMGTHVSYLRDRFGKEVMVLETAYGWTRDMNDESADNILNQGLRGYSFSPEGQLQFMTDLTQSLMSNGALGVVYWEPAWVSTTCSTRWGQGSHWENATFFDFQNDNEVLPGMDFLSHDYLFPTLAVDGVIDDAYGEPFVEDATGDGLDNIAELDLANLYVTSDIGSLFVAVTVAGNINTSDGYYLLYIDTTNDEQGADDDVLRRPITVADPYKPEFRLDITMREERGTTTASYALNAWINGDWEEITFTGAASVDASTIELQFPRVLLGNPDVVNLALVSTNSGRASTAGDILGTDESPVDWSEDIILQTFFSYTLD